MWVAMVSQVNGIDLTRGLHVSHLSGINEICEVAVGHWN